MKNRGFHHSFTCDTYARFGIMPAKKHKIVSTQRSAFWPCGSCRQNCKTEPICCDACRRWHHASCEGLTDLEFSFFNVSDAPCTCNDCFLIELGKSPYEYLYALTGLRQVNIINEMQSIHTSLSADILLRLDECWMHGEDTLKCDTFQI